MEAWRTAVTFTSAATPADLADHQVTEPCFDAGAADAGDSDDGVTAATDEASGADAVSTPVGETPVGDVLWWDAADTEDAPAVDEVSGRDAPVATVEYVPSVDRGGGLDDPVSTIEYLPSSPATTRSRSRSPRAVDTHAGL